MREVCPSTQQHRDVLMNERQENIHVHDSPVATLSRKRMCLNLHPYLQNGRATQRCQLRNNIGLAGERGKERDCFMSVSILCCSFEIMGLVLSLETDLCGKATLFCPRHTWVQWFPKITGDSAQSSTHDYKIVNRWGAQQTFNIQGFTEGWSCQHLCLGCTKIPDSQKKCKCSA